MRAADLSLLEEVLETAEDERPLQAYFEHHPGLLASLLGSGWSSAVVPRIDLGGRLEPDFLLAEADSAGIHWWFVELESPTATMLMAKGEFAAKTRHAIGQIEDWRRWIANNLDTARRPRDQDGLGLVDIRPEYSRGLVLIGRREDVLGAEEEGRQREPGQSRILVRTYDWLTDALRSGPSPGAFAHLPAEYTRYEPASAERVDLNDVLGGLPPLYGGPPMG